MRSSIVYCIMIVKFESFSFKMGVFQIVKTVEALRHIPVNVSTTHIAVNVMWKAASDVAGKWVTSLRSSVRPTHYMFWLWNLLNTFFLHVDKQYLYNYGFNTGGGSHTDHIYCLYFFPVNCIAHWHLIGNAYFRESFWVFLMN